MDGAGLRATGERACGPGCGLETAADGAGGAPAGGAPAPAGVSGRITIEARMHEADSEAEALELAGRAALIARFGGPETVEVPPYSPTFGAGLPRLSAEDAVIVERRESAGRGVWGATLGFGWLPPSATGKYLQVRSRDAADAELHLAVTPEMVEAHRLDKARQQGRPAITTLRLIDTGSANRWGQLATIEANTDTGDDYGLVLLPQTIRIDRLLFLIFLEGAATLSTVIASHLHGTLGASVVTDYFAGTREPTLWLLEWWLVGLKRALAATDAGAVAYVHRRFRSPASRYAGERQEIIPLLRRGGLHRFVTRMRERYRNPLAHGKEIHVASPDYQLFCEQAYATKSLQQWLDIGVAPAWHTTNEVGWVSALATSAAERRPA